MDRETIDSDSVETLLDDVPGQLNAQQGWLIEASLHVTKQVARRRSE
jgi:hypothetical protein